MPRSRPSTPDKTISDNEQGQPDGDRAAVALDAQIELMAWLDTAKSVEMINHFVSFYDAARRVRLSNGQQFKYADVDILRDMWREQLADMPTYYVTAEMCRVAAAAAADMPECPVILPQDLPSMSGFVYFATAPIYAEYGEGSSDTRLRIRAIAWRNGTVAWGGEDADPNRAFERMHNHEGDEVDIPGLTYTMWCRGPEMVEDYAKSQHLSVDAIDLFNGTRWMPFEMSGWAHGRPYRLISHDEPPRSGLVIPEVEWQRRYLVALFALMNQEIVIVEQGRLNRAAWKRLKRQQERTPGFGDIKIVRLRRGYNPMLELAIDDMGEMSRDGVREWTHRWPVRGHWRNQPFGPGRTQTRRVWIAPFIKGPQDKPLVIKDTIYSLER